LDIALSGRYDAVLLKLWVLQNWWHPAVNSGIIIQKEICGCFTLSDATLFALGHLIIFSRILLAIIRLPLCVNTLVATRVCKWLQNKHHWRGCDWYHRVLASWWRSSIFMALITRYGNHRHRNYRAMFLPEETARQPSSAIRGMAAPGSLRRNLPLALKVTLFFDRDLTRYASPISINAWPLLR
jgi:hypothetical protein